MEDANEEVDFGGGAGFEAVVEDDEVVVGVGWFVGEGAAAGEGGGGLDVVGLAAEPAIGVFAFEEDGADGGAAVEDFEGTEDAGGFFGEVEVEGAEAAGADGDGVVVEGDGARGLGGCEEEGEEGEDLRGGVHLLAAEEGEADFGVEDLARGYGKDIAVEDDEVGEFAGFEGAFESSLRRRRRRRRG